MSYGSPDFEKAKSSYNPYPPQGEPRARSASLTPSLHGEGPMTRNRSAELLSTASAAIPSDIVALHPFQTAGSDKGSRDTSLQARVFGQSSPSDKDTAVAPPPAPPPVPLVPQLTPSFSPPAQLTALVVSTKVPDDKDETEMDVDRDAGGARSSTSLFASGISPSSAATAAAFAPRQDGSGRPDSLAGSGLLDPQTGTGPPATSIVPLFNVQENEKLRFQNQQQAMQIEAMKAMIESMTANANNKENEAKRCRHDAETTRAVSEAR